MREKYKIFSKISLILSFLFITSYGYTDEISSSISKEKSKLANITKNIHQKRNKLKQLTHEEKNTQRKLAEVGKQLELTSNRLNQLKGQLANVHKDVCSNQRALETTNAELKTKQSIFLKRLNAIYKYRGGEVLEILLDSDNIAELSNHLYFMSLIAKTDSELIKEIKKKKYTCLEIGKILQANYNKISKIKGAQEEILNRQKRLKTEKERLLAKICSEKSLYQREIAELERTSLEIKQLIKKLEAKKPQIGKYIVRGRGDLPWPVKNRKLYREFGKYKHPKFNAYVVNKGIDILANEGEIVSSIKEGKVVFANWFKGYGRVVIIDHGEGLYSLYANLGSILVTVGERVSKGSPIGKVGSPLSEDRYNLHFEIRVHGEPQDPLDWLTRG